MSKSYRKWDEAAKTFLSDPEEARVFLIDALEAYQEDGDQGGFAHFGVTRAMILEWERNKREPAVKFIPKIIEFLRYEPFEKGETLGERIRIYRKTLGLSHYEFARKLGVAPCTIIGWENNRVKNIEKKIRPYLDGQVEF